MLDYDDLHDYQKRAVDWVTDPQRSNGFLWLGMGDGKTVIGATAIAALDRGALVVGTKRIVETTWPNELAKWRHLEHLSFAAAVGPKRHREKAVAKCPDVLGVSYENLKWLLESGGARGRTVILFDEITKMKSPSTRRFKTLKKAIAGSKTPLKIFGMTATPTLEGHGSLWAQWKSIGGDDRIGRTITDFRNHFTQPIFKGNFTDYQVHPRHAKKIERYLQDDIFTIDDSDRPYQPNARIEDVIIPWGTTGARDVYTTAEKHMIIELGKRSFAAASAGVAMNKCRQLASGFVYDQEGEEHWTDDGKIDAVVEAVEELQGAPVLIFYQFKAERNALAAALPNVKVLGKDVTPDDLEGQILLHPRSASHGLNLQSCRYAFFVSVPLSGEEYVQAIGRIDRQGQTGQPVIKRFVRAGTIDEESIVIAEGKKLSDEEVVARVKARQS